MSFLAWFEKSEASVREILVSLFLSEVSRRDSKGLKSVDLNQQAPY